MNGGIRMVIATALLLLTQTASAADPALPAPLTLRYALRYGELTVGHVTKTLELDDEGKYRHHSKSVPEGMARWFTHVEWNEEGRFEVADGNVRPLRFLEFRVGADKPHRHEAVFDWPARKIRYASGAVVDLPAGTQDQGSLLYAFMLHPPVSGKSQSLSVSTGKKLLSYQYADAGEDRLKTGIGQLQTRIVERVVRDPGEEGFRIWLATEYRNLPIRIETRKRGQLTVLELESAQGALTFATPKR